MARVWFTYAADSGHAEGKNNLAKMLIRGFQVFAVPDYKMASRLLQESASAGHRGALTDLRYMAR